LHHLGLLTPAELGILQKPWRVEGSVVTMMEFKGRNIHFYSKVKFPYFQYAEQDVSKFLKLNFCVAQKSLLYVCIWKPFILNCR